MNVIEILAEFFTRPASETRDKVPVGHCPNCWGEQEYDQQIRDMYKDKQIDVNNHEANYAFIQDFVVTHLSGIHLKKGNNSFECPTCHVRYSEEELKKIR
jgi:hypothetical protein